MIYLLSYPRSGRNLLSHMLKCVDIEVTMTHRFIISEQLPLKESDTLIMLLRDYREAIPRHLYPKEPISTVMTTKAFGREFGIRDRATQYIENLVLYDMCQTPKHLVHYETIMKWGRTAFGELAVGLGVNQQKYIGIDWVKEKGISLKKYDAPAMSEGDLKFHAKRLEDIPHLDKAMKDCNPYIFKKYLTQYHES